VNAVGKHRYRVLVLAALLLGATAAFAQAQEPPGKPQPEVKNDLLLNWTDVEKNIWATAKPYLDYPLPALEAAVPELKGLEPAPSQEKLSFILARVGDKCVNLLQRTPNVISREEVITQAPHAKPWRQRFGYLLTSRQTPSGAVLGEYRTDDHGNPVGEGAGSGPISQGFAAMWVRLFPGNQPESRFRYLGQQEIDKHKTFVLAFAQVPNLVKFPAEFLFQGTRISILYQGVAWIDSSDFRIVRMREDLLAPRPDAYLERFTAQIRFDEVSISKAASSLWLPQEAIIEWEFKGQFVQQRHVYSHYRLYEVKTRILPAG
jgi:hypothetical protein